MTHRRAAAAFFCTAALSLLALLAACEKPPKVRVACVWAEGGASCTVEHLQGSVPVRACWEITSTCANRHSFKARACQHVEPASTAATFVPLDSFVPEGPNSCDRYESSTVGNLHVTAE